MLINHKESIKQHFFTNPNDKLRVRELERKLKMPLPSVIRYVKELQKENILTVNKIGNTVFYIASRAHKEFIIEKKLSNLKQIYFCGLIEYLIEEFSNPLIILFGSYSKGEDIESSDIDIFIQTRSRKKISINLYETKLGRKIQLFTFESIGSIPNKNLANNILNGITLNGYIEVIK